MNNKLKKSTIVICAFLLQTTVVLSQNLDLNKATIVCFEKPPETVKYSKIEHFVNAQVKEKEAVLHVIDINGNEFDTITV
jgi:hypothetical protein